MSEYPYEGGINSDDILNCKDVFSSDGAIIVQVEAALGESFIVRSEEGDIEIKYEIPRLEMERIVDGEITAKQNKENIQKKYETSSIAKYQITRNNKQFLRMKVETLCFMISRNLKLSSKNASQIESVYKALAKSIARNSQGRSCKACQEKASGTSSST